MTGKPTLHAEPLPLPAANQPACETCLYFQTVQNSHGHCLRYPPVYCGNGSPVENHRWKHPLVLASNWCGEYRKTERDDRP